MNKTENTDYQGYIFIRNTVMHTGMTPSLREICRAVGYKSPRSIQMMLQRLEKKGLLSYVDGVIILTLDKPAMNAEQTVGVPLVGSVACGIPIFAEENREAIIQVSTKIAHPNHKYYLLRAKGTSMNKSGIQPDDLVLVRQQPTAEERDMVVALINDEATIKHLHREEDVIILRPNSTDPVHQPIVVTDDLIIQGVVVKVLPKSII